MSNVLRACVFGLLSSLGACVPAYHPPTLDEPHALVKVRRTYDTVPGATLHETLLVDDHSALRAQVPAGLAAAARIDTSLVFPTPATFVMSSMFTHQEWKMVQEQYTEQEMYMDNESYDCSSGFGTTAVHRTCSRMVTRYRPVTRHRWVNRLVDVIDADCRAEHRFAPAVNRVYLLQYSFQEHAACSLSCFEQIPNPDGTFTNSTCPAAPPTQ
jgi:hypothetical protein